MMSRARQTMSRTTATELLWAHLRPKETRGQPPDSGIPLPPIAPVDKNGTSIRILLHDTQANVEKFSARIDKMIDEISESKSEIVSVKKLFDGERESLSNDLYELGKSSVDLRAKFESLQSTDARRKSRKRSARQHKLQNLLS